MPIRTEPPDLAVAACCDHFGCERAIERRMPFGGNFRFDACKIVEACQHFLVSAVRTAIGAPRPVHDLCSPFVTKRAPPPECLMATGHHLRRREVSVFCWVPFGGDGGEPRGKVVIACLRHIVCADRTASAHSDARFRGSLPFVTVGAEPPDFAAVSGHYHLRRQIKVFFPIPLRTQRRVRRG